MSIASYVEFTDLPKMGAGHFTPTLPGKTRGYGEVDFSGGENTATMGVDTKGVYVSVDAICRVRFDGTATTTTGYRMVAGQSLVFAVISGSTLSAIGAS